MQKKSAQKIVIIGCGNLAWHLAKHFSSLKKFEIFVYNHKPNKKLSAFKKELRCKVETKLGNLIADGAYYFICVSDKYISEVSERIKPSIPTYTVIHTSGSKDLEELSDKIKNKAVFYPLQTFSENDNINWKEVPLLIEGKNKYSLKQTFEIAKLFSNNIVALNSSERLKLHLAAVLVNNFTNALYTAADHFLRDNVKNKNAQFNLLLPLIEQTSKKLRTINPTRAQTGPAKRGDKKVLKQHLKLLNKDKTLHKIYEEMSELIAKQQNR